MPAFLRVRFAGVAGSSGTGSGAAFFRVRLAGRGAAVAAALTSGGSIPGTQRSMLRRVALKLTTIRSTVSPSFMTERALRGVGTAISRSGT